MQPTDLFDTTDADTATDADETEADRVTSGSYEDHRRRQEAEANAALAEFYKGSNALERREMRKLGLNKPAPVTISGAVEDLGANRTGPVDYDDDGEAKEAPDADAATEDNAADAEGTALAVLREKYADGLRRIFSELLHQRNRSLAVECMSLATGVVYEGDSEADIGRKYLITRAAVSKRCVELCDRMGIEPSQAMMRDWQDYMNESTPEEIDADLSRVDESAGL